MRNILIVVCFAFILLPNVSFALDGELAVLNSAEADLVRLANQARTDPKGFSDQYLKGSYLPSAKEAYAEMQALSPMRPLIPVKGLIFSAQDHAIDMGEKGGSGHEGSDNSQPMDRMTRYSKDPISGFAENCDYGYLKPIDILLHLIIDEGVLDRGHRKNLLNPGLGYVGVAIRPHTGFRWNAVVDFAPTWTDKAHLESRHAFSLDSESLGITLERTASDSVFRPLPHTSSSENSDLPEFVVARRGFWSASLGYLGLPIPSSGLAHLGRMDLGYTWINQGLCHQFRLNLALGNGHQAYGAEYGFGIGPRSGTLHVGLLIGAGYAHLWDPKSDYIHGFMVGLSPFVIATFWKSFQISLNAGLAFLPLATSKIETPDRAFLGLTAGVGFHFSIDPFLYNQ
jgi:uncharacterized protein YkwD